MSNHYCWTTIVNDPLKNHVFNHNVITFFWLLMIINSYQPKTKHYQAITSNTIRETNDWSTIFVGNINPPLNTHFLDNSTAAPCIASPFREFFWGYHLPRAEPYGSSIIVNHDLPLESSQHRLEGSNWPIDFCYIFVVFFVIFVVFFCRLGLSISCHSGFARWFALSVCCHVVPFNDYGAVKKMSKMKSDKNQGNDNKNEHNITKQNDRHMTKNDKQPRKMTNTSQQNKNKMATTTSKWQTHDKSTDNRMTSK